MDTEVQPQPLTSDFLFNRTKEISPSVSAAIYSIFQKSGLLDSAGFLLEDPRWGHRPAFAFQTCLSLLTVGSIAFQTCLSLLSMGSIALQSCLSLLTMGSCLSELPITL